MNMTRTLVGILSSTVLAIGYAPSAEAAAFLNIDVSGTAVSCNNSLAFNAANCGVGFTTIANSGDIAFSGIVNGVTFGSGGAIAGIQLVGNQLPAGAAFAFATDTKTTVFNNSGAAQTITIGFADNDYTDPLGTPVFFNATQSVLAVSGTGAMSSNFTGWGSGANTLVVGAGSASVTPACLTVASPPTNSCATVGPVNSFVRAGNFALSGLESYLLANGGTINAQGSVVAFTVNTAVPEPGSVLLLGAGLVGLAATIRRRARKQ